MWLPRRILFLFFIVAAFVVCGLAQNAEDSRPGNNVEKDAPKSIQETLEKMRIEKDKKDHDEMIEHGDEVAKISDQLERSVEQNGKLSNDDMARLARVEKLAKKIREELGGKDDDGEEDDDGVGTPSLTDAAKILKTSTSSLYEELKKTSRFTVSAAAIQSTNTVLRLARLLKINK